MLWVDYLIIGIVLVSALIGVFRGFLREVISLIALVAAFLVSYLFGKPFAEILAGLIATPTIRLAVSYAGLFVLVGQQAIINIAVNLNMIPTKGMTLPFISYGGSSMLAMGLTLGLALALTRRRPGAYTPTEGLAKAGAFT